jgi:hypothetical protein
MLDRMNASMKEHMQEMMARIDTKQAEMKDDQAKAIANKEDVLDRMEEMMTTRKRRRPA